jgi:hypothetical protein
LCEEGPGKAEYGVFDFRILSAYFIDWSSKGLVGGAIDHFAVLGNYNDFNYQSVGPKYFNEETIRMYAINYVRVVKPMLELLNQPNLLEYSDCTTSTPAFARRHNSFDCDYGLKYKILTIRPGSHGTVKMPAKTDRRQPLHYVRGHWKPSIKKWIKGYWRGDTKYGVVLKDYKVVPWEIISPAATAN